MNKFLIELVKRFVSKSPKFFQIIQFGGLALFLLSFVPAAMLRYGFTLHHPWDLMLQDVARYAGLGAAFIAKLTVLEPGKVATLPATKKEVANEK